MRIKEEMWQKSIFAQPVAGLLWSQEIVISAVKGWKQTDRLKEITATRSMKGYYKNLVVGRWDIKLQSIKLYNSKLKKIEELKPVHSGEVRMYSCGPTVYDSAHIGNLRAYVFNDVLYRTLKAIGYEVKWVMNITDIDDKTIKRAKDESVSLKDITDKYYEKFMSDLRDLNICVSEIQFVKATDNLQEMKQMAESLVEKGYAYKADDGIYFDVSSLPEYGNMAGVNIDTQTSKSRINNDTYDKTAVQDFALWKNDPDFPDGRPGWHIECSVMAQKYLGLPFDIHTGGVDLIFPHHTNEMAQTKAATGKDLANLWLHNEHLLVDGRKMSKSEGNYITLDVVKEKGFSPLVLRLELMKAHYRSKLDFSWESMKSSQQLLLDWRRIASACETKNNCKSSAFTDALMEDLQLPVAIAKINSIAQTDCGALIEADKILGLKLNDKSDTEEVDKMVKEMDAARSNSDFNKSDHLRHQIESLGYVIENSATGSRVIKK